MASSPPWDYIAKLVCIGDSGCGKSSLTIRLCEGRFSAQHDVTIGVEFGSRIVPVGPPHSTKRPPQIQSSQPADLTSDSDGAAAAPKKPEGLPTPRTAPKDQSQQQQQDSPEQKHMKLSLWDTAGQETYKSVTRSYFRGASGALLVFDITRKQTFLHVTDWLNDLRQIAEPDIVVVLVGNKLDRASEVPQDEEASAANKSSRPDDGKTGTRREVSRTEAEEWAKQNGVLHYVETSAKSGENVEAAFMNVAERIFENINAGKYDLNDRRSGVKGPGQGTTARAVQLSNQKKAAGGGCC